MTRLVLRLWCCFFLVPSISALAPLAETQASTCSNANVAQVTKTTSAVQANGRIYFRTKGLELDFDGSPRAYGVRDQGEEDICVGLAPKAPPCACQYRGDCRDVCRSTFADWSRNNGNPKEIAKTMVSVGLGGGECSPPKVSLQASPRQEWFVSETSLKTSPTAGKVDLPWLQGQGAQLDPAAVRYLVVPGALTKAPWNVRFGDVGIAFNAASKQLIPFIVGDGGGLGEGSVSLLAALLPDKPPQLKKRISALGEEVMRYTSGIDGDFRFVIFPGTASNVPPKNLPHATEKVTARDAAELPDWINKTALEAFKKSSMRDVGACSGLAPAIIK